MACSLMFISGDNCCDCITSSQFKNVSPQGDRWKDCGRNGGVSEMRFPPTPPNNVDGATPNNSEDDTHGLKIGPGLACV